MEKHFVSPIISFYSYADDSQLYLPLSSDSSRLDSIIIGFQDIKNGMAQNLL